MALPTSLPKADDTGKDTAVKPSFNAAKTSPATS